MNSKIFKTMDSRVSKKNKKETGRAKNSSIVDKSALPLADFATKQEPSGKDKNSKKAEVVEQKGPKTADQKTEKLKIEEKNSEKNPVLIEKEKRINSGKKSAATRVKQAHSIGLLFEEPKKKKAKKTATIEANKNSLSALPKNVSNDRDSDLKNKDTKAELVKKSTDKAPNSTRENQDSQAKPKIEEKKDKATPKERKNSRGLQTPEKSKSLRKSKSKRSGKSSSAGIRFDPLSNTKPISAIFSGTKVKGSPNKLKTSEQDLKGPRRTIEEIEHESNEDSEWTDPRNSRNHWCRKRTSRGG
jgi:hypothetical protein